jgi:hypothetical protein
MALIGERVPTGVAGVGTTGRLRSRVSQPFRPIRRVWLAPVTATAAQARTRVIWRSGRPIAENLQTGRLPVERLRRARLVPVGPRLERLQLERLRTVRPQLKRLRLERLRTAGLRLERLRAALP